MIDPFPKARTASFNRRRYVRVPFLQPVSIVACDGRSFGARSTDISNGGVGITCRASFRLGDEVGVVFRLKDERLVVRVERVPCLAVNFVADLEADRVRIEFNKPLHSSTTPTLARVVERL